LCGNIEIEIAQEAYNKASEAERKSLDEIQKLEKKVQTDYGPDEAFAKLVDQCIEFKDHE
jgi:protein kinase C substrate 80K-H